MACDVAQQDQVDELVARPRDQLGPIDLLAHGGAISNIADHSELTFDLWFETIDVNLNGAFRVLFAVKDEMLQRRRGSIVLISSVAALRPRPGRRGTPGYRPAKSRCDCTRSPSRSDSYAG